MPIPSTSRLEIENLFVKDLIIMNEEQSQYVANYAHVTVWSRPEKLGLNFSRLTPQVSSQNGIH